MSANNSFKPMPLRGTGLTQVLAAMEAVRSRMGKHQLDVHGQLQLTRSKIESLTQGMRSGLRETLWLSEALTREGLDPQAGILVEFSCVPCGGDEQFGCALWLSPGQQFFAIEATVGLYTGQLVELERWEDVTGGIAADPRAPGIGKSAARIALELLHEMAGS